MTMTAIRGAIKADENTASIIEKAAFQCKFVDGKYPAVGITKVGYTEIPMMRVAEMPVEGSLARCIRILVLANDDLDQDERPVYLEGAKN
ncbi:MAG: chorismate mutase [Clostridia bacterium]|jgi:chorismate mutase